MGQNLGVGFHPTEDDQPPYLGEGASDWDGGGEEEEEDLACLRDNLPERSQSGVGCMAACRSGVLEESRPA